MDFAKLNVEFGNIQKTIEEYNNLKDNIKNRIKNNLKDISKYEIKIKNTKESLLKESYKLIVLALKNETSFLENITNNGANNERETTSSTI